MLEVFNEYVSNYDMDNEKIKGKYEHTLRVKSLCEEIAKKLDLSHEQIMLAGACGLYHDIARFEQAKRFDSFDDLKTIDHGDLGYEIFINEIFQSKNIISKSILYHNKLSISELTDEEKLFVNITRDADKIDIIYIYSNLPGRMKDDNGAICDNVRNDFMNHKPVNIMYVTNKREKNILRLAFIWDINYNVSYRIIKENKYFEQMEKVLNNSIYNEYFQVIKNFLKEK